MNASVAFRWRNAEMLVLAPLYGKQIDAVLSRAARKPVQPCRMSSGIPIPGRPAVRSAA
jgi:hypothetical protein